MPSGAGVLGDGPVDGEEPLRVSWGLEPLHPPLSLARRLVGVLGAIVQIAMLPMLHTIRTRAFDVAHGATELPMWRCSSR
jgi:hypothetical protein